MQSNGSSLLQERLLVLHALLENIRTLAKTSCKDCTAGKYQDTIEATSCKDSNWNGLYCCKNVFLSCMPCWEIPRQYKQTRQKLSFWTGYEEYWQHGPGDCGTYKYYTGSTTSASPAGESAPSGSGCGTRSWTAHKLPKVERLSYGNDCGTLRHWRVKEFW